MRQNGLKNENWKLIPIQKIIFDKGMSHIAKEKCDDVCKGVGIRKFKGGILLPMVKWDKVHADFKEKKALDPIVVKAYNNTGYYEIIDGRHRCILSHYNKYTHIPCIHYMEEAT